jgi:uncharacterized protein
MTSSARRADRTRIAVFAKAPVAGRVKTRLAPLLGEEEAARLHAQLVRRALRTAVDAGLGEVELWCAPDESHAFFGECRERFGAPLHRQVGGDLGERMRHALDAGTGRGERVLLIGSDCPAITPDHLVQAAAALPAHDAVFTPAEDGGYVLVGLARAVPCVFEDVAWGGDAVMATTRERLAAAGARWWEMPPLWDVDRPDDYHRLQREGLLRDLAP